MKSYNSWEVQVSCHVLPRLKIQSCYKVKILAGTLYNTLCIWEYVCTSVYTHVNTHARWSLHTIQQGQHNPCRGADAYYVNIYEKVLAKRRANRQHNRPMLAQQARNLKRHLSKCQYIWQDSARRQANRQNNQLMLAQQARNLKRHLSKCHGKNLDPRYHAHLCSKQQCNYTTSTHVVHLVTFYDLTYKLVSVLMSLVVIHQRNKSY